jgi:SAM-dependent methyltransferase
MTMQPPCPACGGTATATRLRISADEATAHFVPHGHANFEPLRQHIRQLWAGDTAELKQCSGCGFGFCWPYRAGDAEFYRLAYPTTSYPVMKWEFGRTIAALRKIGAKPRSILEVGAGDGFFLRLLTPDFCKTAQMEATEFNAAAVRRLQADGIQASATDIRGAEWGDRQGAFDAIFLFQVVEHMDDLHGLFGRLSALLAADGHIFIAVPNTFRTSFNEDNGSLIDMPPNHVGRWTEKAFAEASRPHGLNVLEAAIEPFSLKRFARQDIYYSHRRRAQTEGTFSAQARKVKSPAVRKVAEPLAALAGVPGRLPVWLRAARATPHLGGALWVHLARSH